MLVILLMVVLVCAVYEPVRHHGFVNYDDDVYVTENRKVAEGLGREGLVYAFTHVGDYPRPVTVLSHMLDCTLFGLNPEGHHLTNLGVLLARAGRFPEAQGHFEEALRIQPGCQDARRNLTAARTQGADPALHTPDAMRKGPRNGSLFCERAPFRGSR